MDKKSIFQTLFWIAGIVSTVLITFNMGKGYGEDASETKIAALEEKLAFYKKTDKLNLPKLISDLDTVTTNLNKSLSDSEFITLIQKENTNLKTDLSIKTANLDSLTKENTILKETKEKLNEDLIKVRSDFYKLSAKKNSITISEGESDFLINNGLLIGVTNIWSNSVDFNLDNKKSKLEVGQQVKKEIGGQTAIITLKKVIKQEKFDNDLKNKCQFDFTLVKKE